MENGRKKAMITVRKAPHGSGYVQEALDVMFIMASYDLDLSVVFLDDGVWALKQGQDTSGLGIKGFAPSMGALTDWDITQVYVDGSAMTQRNIKMHDLISIGEDDNGVKIHPEVLDTEKLSMLLRAQDAIVSF